MQALGWLVTIALAVVAVATVAPAAVGLSETIGFAQVVALRGPAALGGLVVGGLLVLAGTRRRRVARGRRWTFAHRRTLVLGLVAVAVGLAHGFVQVSRGWATPAPTGPGLTVIAFNTQDDVSGEAIAHLTAEAGAEVVALPETPAATVRAAAAALARRGTPYAAFTSRASPQPGDATSLLVSAELGRYRRIEAPYVGLGAVRAAPVDGEGPVLAAVHPPPPRPPAYPMDEWKRYVDVAADICRLAPGTIVAGDFNATLDHEPLRDLGFCEDAAAASGAGAAGTWPSRVPPPLATPIDHVLYDQRAWEAVSTRSVRVPGSDHRALIARLAPR